MCPGWIPILHPSGLMMPGQLGPTRRDFVWFLSALTTSSGGSANGALLDPRPTTYPDLVRLGDTLGNTNDQWNLVVDGFNNGVSSCWRWDIDHGRIGLSLLDSLDKNRKKAYATHPDLSILTIPKRVTASNSPLTSFTDPNTGKQIGRAHV